MLREQVKEVINLKIRIDLLENNSLDLDNMDCQHKIMKKGCLQTVDQFIKNTDLEGHLKSNHENESQYSCDHWDKKCALKG